MWTEDSSGILGTAEADDGFGARLAFGDFDCDGYADLVAGRPAEDVGTAADAGAVAVLYGSSGGLTSVNDLWFQGDSGVNGTSEADDDFGDAVATGDFDGDDCSDLLIGAPGETWSGHAAAGDAYLSYGASTVGLSSTGDFTLIQGTLQGSVAANDRFATRFWVDDRNADGYDDVVIMSPGECGGGDYKGFNYVYGSGSGLTTTNNVLFCEVHYHE